VNWSAIVWLTWLGSFVVLEGAAISGRVPWTTLSVYTWMLESTDGVVRWVLLIGLAALLTHLVAKWP
jgi:hypothetical protein